MIYRLSHTYDAICRSPNCVAIYCLPNNDLTVCLSKNKGMCRFPLNRLSMDIVNN